MKKSFGLDSDKRREQLSKHNLYYYPDNMQKWEDVRISKLLRKLSHDDDTDSSLALCKQIQDMLSLTENRNYIQKSYELNLDLLYDILLRQVNLNVKQDIYKCIGCVGIVLDSQFNSFADWLFHKLSSCKNMEINHYMVKAFFYSFEGELNISNKIVNSIIENLKMVLENVDCSEVLIPIVNISNFMGEKFHHLFSPHFSEFVDILVGWHIDSIQSPSLVLFISKSLSAFGIHWIDNAEFTITLLSQFLEDMEVFYEDLSAITNKDDLLKQDLVDLKQCEEKIFSLTCVFNTVFFSLFSHTDKSYNIFSSEFINDSLKKILISFISVFDYNHHCDNLLLNVSQSFCLFLSFTQLPESLEEQYYDLLFKLIDFFHELETVTRESVLKMLSKTVRAQNTKLPLEFLQTLIGPKSKLLFCQRTEENKVHLLYLQVYHDLLNIKNVQLLQESYKCITNNLITIEQRLGGDSKLPDSEYYDSIKELKIDELQIVGMFLLQALSLKANTSNSILDMWVLSPSILDFLIRLANNIESKYFFIQYAVLKLLSSHCCCHNHFMTTSFLISNDSNNENIAKSFRNDLRKSEDSPTSGNFEIILTFLFRMLEKSDQSITVKKLYLNWSLDILSKVKPYFKLLIKNVSFQKYLSALLKLGLHDDFQIQLLVVDNLRYLLEFLELIDNELALNFVSVCEKNMSSSNKIVSREYSDLYTSMPPLPIEISNFSEHHKDEYLKQSSSNFSNLNYFSKMDDTVMKSQDFTEFILYFLDNLDNVSSKSWIDDIIINNSSLEKLQKHEDWVCHRNILANDILKTRWICWEGAQFCVKNKLKTPIGKPQETLSTIEGVIKSILKDTIIGLQLTDPCEKKTFCSVSQSKIERSQVLVEFIFSLEKSMFMAWEGSAFLSKVSNKLIKSFFRTNKATCQEWLNRIRVALVMLSFYSGKNELVIWNSYQYVTYGADRNLGNPEFENVIRYMTNSMMKLKNSKSIEGLYMWLKDCGKPLFWMKPAIQMSLTKHERALELYKEVYKKIDLSNIKLKPIISNIELNALKCGSLLGDYTSWQNWKLAHNLETSSEFDDVSLAVYKNRVKVLSNFGEENFDALHNLEPNLYSLIQENAILNVESEIIQRLGKAFICSENFESDIKSSIEERFLQMLKNYSLNYNDDILRHLRVMVFYIKQCFDISSVCSSDVLNFQEVARMPSSLLISSFQWSELLSLFKPSLISADIINQFYLEIAKSARREENFLLSEKYLKNYFFHDSDEDILESNVIGSWEMHLTTPYTQFACQGLLQASKLSYATGKKSIAFKILSNLLRDAAKNCSWNTENFLKPLVKYLEWLKKEDNEDRAKIISNSNLHVVEFSPAQRTNLIMNENECESFLEKSNSLDDKRFSNMLLHCCSIDSDYSKLWSCFADWCINAGKKYLEDCTSSKNLTESEIFEIKSCFAIDIPEETVTNVLNEFKKTSFTSDFYNYEIKFSKRRKNIHESEFIKEQKFDEELIGKLKKCQQLILNRVYFYHKIALRSYIRHIDLCNDNYHSINSTLQLLQLAMRYSSEMQLTDQDRESLISCKSWKNIALQLLSWLHYNEEVSRNIVCDILCKIAESFPDSIIYGIVVGYLDSYAENSSLDKNSHVYLSYEKILNVMKKDLESEIDIVKSFVGELKKVSILWHEIWLNSLLHQNNMMIKHVLMIQEEMKQFNEPNEAKRNNIWHEKLKNMYQSVILNIEALCSSTISKVPETEHEALFQSEFGSTIDGSLKSLQSTIDIKKPLENWLGFKKILKALQDKSYGVQINLKNVSEKLCELSGTNILMPGLETLEGENKVFIHKVDSKLTILPTKTKPKKLMLIGTDGRKYPYLLKGSEDLNLDERIMQFLNIINILLQKTLHNTVKKKARTYSVIPLSKKCGLIQWVDGCMPMFAIYKRWQQREMAVSKQKQKSLSNVSVPKPSELFYSKLMPILKRHNIASLDKRKEWPIEVIRQVLLTLVSETPKNLLSSEIWCCTQSSSGWWDLTQSYCQSLAVMSVIGYIIGLGDRHLDNILFDMSLGEIVHIDYNICFEKGKNLRIPERVPFRLTQNFLHALGVGGIEGNFRRTSQSVMHILRNHKDILLTLLESFIYDPLMEISPLKEIDSKEMYKEISKYDNKGSPQSRTGFENWLTYSMFTVNVTEVKFELTTLFKNTSLNYEELKRVGQDLFENFTLQDELNENLTHLHEQVAMLKEAEVNPAHNLFTLSDRYTKYKLIKKSIQKVNLNIVSELKEQKKWDMLHKKSQALIRGREFSQLLKEVNISVITVNDDWKNFFELIGDNSYISNFCTCQQGIGQIFSEIQTQMKICFDLFFQYNAISAIYPPEILNNHRTSKFQTWLEELLECSGSEHCKKIHLELLDLYGYNQSVQVANRTKAILQQQNIQGWIKELRNYIVLLYEEYLVLNKSEITQSQPINFFFEEFPSKSVILHILMELTHFINSFQKFGNISFDENKIFDFRTDFLYEKIESFEVFNRNLIFVLTKIQSQTLQYLDHSSTCNCLRHLLDFTNLFVELDSLFLKVLLPEAFKSIQRGDSSVDEIYERLKELIADVEQFETIQDKDGSSDKFSDIQSKFDKIMISANSTPTENIASGQIILVAYNGFFNKFFEILNSVASALKKVDSAENFGSSEQGLIFDAVICINNMNNQFILNKIKSLYRFFDICSHSMTSLEQSDISEKYHLLFLHLFKDLKKVSHGIYKTNYLPFQFNMLSKLMRLLYKENSNTPLTSDNVMDFLSNVQTVLIKEEDSNIINDIEKVKKELEINSVMLSKQFKIKLIDTNIQALKCCSAFSELLLTANQWYYDDYLESVTETPSRSIFLLDLEKIISNFGTLQADFAHKQNLLGGFATELTTKVEEGSNLGHSDLTNTSLLDEIVEQQEHITYIIACLKMICNTSNSILHYETFRTQTTEAANLDSNFLAILGEVKENCISLECAPAILPVEKNIISINEPGSSIDYKFISETVQRISVKIHMLQEQLTQCSERTTLSISQLKDKFNIYTDLTNSFKTNLSDIIPLISTMKKFEDVMSDEMSTFLDAYKKYFDLHQSITKLISISSISLSDINSLLHKLEQASVVFAFLNDNIFDLTELVKEKTNYLNVMKQNSLNIENLDNNPKKLVKQTNKTITAKNLSAITMWKRVEAKLNGRDPDIIKKKSVNEQVDFIINESTNIDNLAQMYEGWTAWV